MSDQKHCKLLDKNPLKDLKENVKNLVTELRTKGYFEEFSKFTFSVINTVLPRFYGLYKIHKEGYPMRIIVSSLNSLTIALKSYVKTVLTKTLPFPKSHIKDSWQFKNKIENTAIPKDHSMISLDATSLFTNIPTKLGFILKKWYSIKKHTNFKQADFSQLVEFLLNNTFFKFDNQFYQQIIGSPMGQKSHQF